MILVLRPLDTKACSAGQQRKDKDGTAHSMWQLVQLPPNGRHGGTADTAERQCSGCQLAWWWLNHKKCVTCSVLRFVPINGLHVMTFVGAGNGLFGSKTTVVYIMVQYGTVQYAPCRASTPCRTGRAARHTSYEQNKTSFTRRSSKRTHCSDGRLSANPPRQRTRQAARTACAESKGELGAREGRKGAERAAP